MPRDGAMTFDDLHGQLDWLDIVCRKCNRHGPRGLLTRARRIARNMLRPDRRRQASSGARRDPALTPLRRVALRNSEADRQMDIARPAANLGCLDAIRSYCRGVLGPLFLQGVPRRLLVFPAPLIVFLRSSAAPASDIVTRNIVDGDDRRAAPANIIKCAVHTDVFRRTGRRFLR